MTLNYTADETLSDSSSKKTDANGTYFKDTSMPDGDACREDGTLKDASEMEWPNSPSESAPSFREPSVLSYLSNVSNGKKRKQDFSDEEDLDIIMKDSQDDNSDDEIEARNKTAGSSASTHRQSHRKRKNEKRKKNNTDDESDADSGESEKEHVVMDETKEDSKPIKVTFFVFLSL